MTECLFKKHSSPFFFQPFLTFFFSSDLIPKEFEFAQVFSSNFIYESSSMIHFLFVLIRNSILFFLLILTFCKIEQGVHGCDYLVDNPLFKAQSFVLGPLIQALYDFGLFFFYLGLFYFVFCFALFKWGIALLIWFLFLCP